MRHARLRQAMARTLIFVSAATAIITVPACNSPRRLEALGGPMVENARVVKKEEPKKTEITLPINIERKIPEPKDVTEVKEETVTVIDKDGNVRKLKKAIEIQMPDRERKKATIFK